MEPKECITLCQGKYVLELNNHTGEFYALRYCEKWRDLSGDKLMLALFYEIQSLQEKIKHT